MIGFWIENRDLVLVLKHWHSFGNIPTVPVKSIFQIYHVGKKSTNRDFTILVLIFRLQLPTLYTSSPRVHEELMKIANTLSKSIWVDLCSLEVWATTPETETVPTCAQIKILFLDTSEIFQDKLRHGHRDGSILLLTLDSDFQFLDTVC